MDHNRTKYGADQFVTQARQVNCVNPDHGENAQEDISP